MSRSNKATRAGNQQERLMMIGWIVGFVDGEGCFSIGFIRQPDRKEKLRVRRGYKTGYQVTPEFAVVQGAKSLECLKQIKDYFGVGAIYINRRYDNHKEHLYRYCVRRREDLMKVIIPFFQRYCLKTSKRGDFDKFVQCVRLIAGGKHFTNDGMIKIAKITEQMNHQKNKSDMIRILRNQTSALAKTR